MSNNIEQLKQAWTNWQAASKKKESAWYHIEERGQTAFYKASIENDMACEKCKQAFLTTYNGKTIADFTDFVMVGPDHYVA